MPRSWRQDSAAALNPAPLAALLVQIKGTAAEDRRIGMHCAVTSKISLIRIIGGKLPDEAPQSAHSGYFIFGYFGGQMAGSLFAWYR